MKKKTSTNIITHWLEEWVSQTNQVENIDNTIFDVFFSIRRPNWAPEEELKSFKFANAISKPKEFLN